MRTNTIKQALVALAIVATVACGGGDGADTAREIELAPADSGAAMSDTAAMQAPEPTPAAPAAAAPAAPATKAPAPRPQAAAPARASTGALSAGATLALASGSRVCTNTHKVGDRFTATTTADIDATNGVTIPAGSEVTLEVVESARGQNGRDNVKLAFKPVSITVRGTTSDLTADVTRVATLEYDRVQSNTTQAKKVATGAAAGAIAGQLLGKDTKSTVAGAVVGAAAGGAVAAATTDYHGCLPANGAITVTLTSQLSVR